MRSRATILAVIATSVATGGASLPTPIVEKERVTVSQMNRDLADCRNKTPAFAFGHPIAPYMRAKGHTTLNPM